MHMLLLNYIPNVIYVHKRNFYVYYRKNEEICPQSHVNFLKAFQSMTFYGTLSAKKNPALVFKKNCGFAVFNKLIHVKLVTRCLELQFTSKSITRSH